MRVTSATLLFACLGVCLLTQILAIIPPRFSSVRNDDEIKITSVAACSDTNLIRRLFRLSFDDKDLADKATKVSTTIACNMNAVFKEVKGPRPKEPPKDDTSVLPVARKYFSHFPQGYLKPGSFLYHGTSTAVDDSGAMVNWWETSSPRCFPGYCYFGAIEQTSARYGYEYSDYAETGKKGMMLKYRAKALPDDSPLKVFYMGTRAERDYDTDDAFALVLLVWLVALNVRLPSRTRTLVIC